MFRERIFEWGFILDTLANAWSQVKAVAKAKNGYPFTQARRRGVKIDSTKADLNRDFGRAFVQPTQFNR